MEGEDHPGHAVGDGTSDGADLSKITETITKFVVSCREDVANSLCSAGRSRLAKKVLNLPSGDVPAVETLSYADLPMARDALVLASCSLAIVRWQEKNYAAASKAADVALILLGLEAGSPLLEFVKLMEERSDFVRTATVNFQLGKPQPHHPIRLPITDFPNFSSRCAERPDLSFPVEDFKHLYFDADRPVVIRGIAQNWPAMSKWPCTSYLSGKFGHRVVPVEKYAQGSAKLHETFLTFTETLTALHDYSVDPSKGTIYLAQHPLFEYIPALEADISNPRLIAAAQKTSADLVNIWMGSAGSGSKLHYDSADNILVQVVGHKTVVLIPEDQSHFLLRTDTVENVSLVDLDNPKDTNYPLNPNVMGVTAHLHPGDGIYIPARFWHWVKATTSSMSVNFWF